MRGDGRFGQAAHPNISITIKKPDHKYNVDIVSDITLLAELLWQFWSKATSTSLFYAPETLSQVAELSCDIEDLISRQDDHRKVFWSTLEDLVMRRSSDADLSMKEKTSFSKKLLRFGRKNSPASGKQTQGDLPIKQKTKSSVFNWSETPWRRRVGP